MPKQTIKRFMPTPGRLRQIKVLRVFGEWIYEPNLWHINRYSASMGFAVGLFVAFVPFPSQMVAAALFAIWLRCNLPLAVGLCWITNPVTMGPIFWFAYKVGALILGLEPRFVPFEISWAWLTSGFLAIWQPFLLGCLVCGFFVGSLGYVTINVLWRWHVVQRWERRRELRRVALEKATRDVALRQEALARRDARDTESPGNTGPGPHR